MKLQITVTRQNIKDAMWCGIKGDALSENCAIALAVRDIFPKANVGFCIISSRTVNGEFALSLPQEATDFVHKFDECTPYDRLHLPELTFEVDLPQGVIDAINIEDLERADNLQLV